MQGAEVSDGAGLVSEMVSAPHPQLISELIRGQGKAAAAQPGMVLPLELKELSQLRYTALAS